MKGINKKENLENVAKMTVTVNGPITKIVLQTEVCSK